MELIKNLEICKKLVDNRKSCISNCFFLPDQMKELVEKGKLYHQSLGDNFLILHKEASFYRVYYFIKESGQLSKVELDMCAVIEFPFRESMTEDQKNQVKLIEKMGFQLERESARMSMKMQECNFGRKVIEFPDLKIEYAHEKDVRSICTLLNETFDELFSFLLPEEELLKHIENHTVLAAYFKDEVVGLYNYEVNGKIVNGGQLAVRDVGSGIGWLIMNRFHQLYRDKVKISRLWSDLTNKSAIRMYEKAGYKFDGCKANEYVYRGKSY